MPAASPEAALEELGWANRHGSSGHRAGTALRGAPRHDLRHRAEGFIATHMLTTIYYAVARIRDRDTVTQALEVPQSSIDPCNRIVGLNRAERPHVGSVESGVTIASAP